MAVPVKSMALVSWGRTFLEAVKGHESEYAVSPAQIAVMEERYDAFAAAQRVVTDALAAGINSGPVFRRRDDTKAAFLEWARPIYSTVQQAPEVPTELKQRVGASPRRKRGRRMGPPNRAPFVQLQALSSRRLRVILQDPDPGSSRRVTGALIFSYIGEGPPADIRDYTFERPTMRQRVTIKVQPSAELRRVWIAVCYFNRRGEMGPQSNPKEIFLVPSGGPSTGALQAA